MKTIYSIMGYLFIFAGGNRIAEATNNINYNVPYTVNVILAIVFLLTGIVLIFSKYFGSKNGQR